MRLPTLAPPGAGRRRVALVTGVALAAAATVSVGLVSAAPAGAGTVTKTFAAGTSGTWTVPQGVTQVQVDLLGGSGGGFDNDYGYGYGQGGAGEHITTRLDVTPGSQYFVHAAGNGADYDYAYGNGNGTGGANGGGAAPPYEYGAGGGGASDLRAGSDDLAGRILVAGGGGGAGEDANGGDAGQPGAVEPDYDYDYATLTAAQPGTQTAGGTGGNYVYSDGYFSESYTGHDGALGQGGNANDYCCGGGGGGGYYGGGGAGALGGGAGGSSYVASGVGLHDTRSGVGDRGADPAVTITYLGPPAQTAALSDLSLPADGTSQGTMTLAVTDGTGVGVPDDQVTFHANDGAVQFGKVTDNGDGTYSVPVTASSKAHDVTITGTDNSVDGVSASSTLTLTPLAQSIHFTTDTPASPVVDGSYDLGAYGGGSGNDVTFTVDGDTTDDACSVSGSTVSFDHAGTCVIDADQAGDDQYAAADTAKQTMTVGQAGQDLQFTSDPPATPAVGGSYDLTTTTGASGNDVTFGVDADTTNEACSVTGATVSFEHVGDCVVDADLPGNDDYAAAHTATQSMHVSAGAQAITFTPLTTPANVGSTQSLAATSTSGADVSFSVDASSDEGACAVDGTTVSFTAAGTCLVDADQAGSDDWTAAPQQQQSVAVQHNATAVSLGLSKSSSVFGESVTSTATVTGSSAGTVQFSVDGSALGSPVDVGPDGTAVSPALTGAGGSALTPGAHAVDAVFTPSDTVTYASAQATTRSLSVAKAGTSSSVTVRAASLSASVAAVAPGQGSATGTVTFSVGGHAVGSAAVSHGVATLAYRTPAGATRQVAAAYAGDANFLASSASTSRSDPTITAHVSSTSAKSRYGWYRGPVTIGFTCATHGAALTTACPAKVTLLASAAGRSVSRTIAAADGGTATVNVTGINIDRSAPRVRISGVTGGARYFAAAPAAKCVGTDALSGVASCVLTHRTSGTHETFTATATDRAGNTARTSVTVTLLTLSVKGAAYRNGAWTVHLGHGYTLLAVAGSRPAYLDAAVAPRAPKGLDGSFHSLGHGRWGLGITVQRALHTHPYWNIGIKVGRTVHVLKLHVVR